MFITLLTRFSRFLLRLHVCIFALFCLVAGSDERVVPFWQIAIVANKYTLCGSPETPAYCHSLCVRGVKGVHEPKRLTTASVFELSIN